FAFTRKLIEEDLIPEDVAIQVLTQCRPHIIEKTFEAVKGAKNVIYHFYNSTSTLQREVVFRKSQAGIKEIAVSAAKLIAELADKHGRERFRFEYSPESFTGTELSFSVEICQEVIDALKCREGEKVIINLPSTVEMATPNIYADQVEYFKRNINRDIILSLHAHNDRGCAVASSELGVMAGGDRVEGTLFGNGERTGNADILVMAMNMYSQGIDCGLDFSDIEKIVESYERFTRLNVHQRHPYAGKLVFSAFSGSHQDAINKGMSALNEKAEQQEKSINEIYWQVPYLPIDPSDVGKSYLPIIRINSQSGGGGIAYVLDTCFGLKLPKSFQRNFASIVKKVTDSENKELLPEELYELFIQEYVNLTEPVSLLGFNEGIGSGTVPEFSCELNFNGRNYSETRTGKGFLAQFLKSVSIITGKIFEVNDDRYATHAIDKGMRSRAISYVELSAGGMTFFGVGISESISHSVLKAALSAINKSFSE
ncbi:MAG: 2-isopropylmalate synthase, partial [Clostridiales bacterium]|nr:2-isopropylmalate synthase [Clostridiales bacterium]